VFLIGVDQQKSTEMIARVTAHLPAGNCLGHILAVTGAGILARSADGDTGAIYGLGDSGDYAWRLIDLDADLRERTLWRDGREIDRYALPASLTGEPDAE
jgi:hypothetical protein